MSDPNYHSDNDPWDLDDAYDAWLVSQHENERDLEPAPDGETEMDEVAYERQFDGP